MYSKHIMVEDLKFKEIEWNATLKSISIGLIKVLPSNQMINNFDYILNFYINSVILTIAINEKITDYIRYLL